MNMHRRIVHNLGVFYVAYELSRLDWEVIPNLGNNNGIDILINRQNDDNQISIKVSTLSSRSATNIGSARENLVADFLVICRNAGNDFENIRTFVLSQSEARELAVCQENRKGGTDCWVEYRDYEQYEGGWDRFV